MYKVNGHPLYSLGTSLGALSVYIQSPGITYAALAQQAIWSKTNLEFFFESGEVPLQLPGCRAASEILIDHLTKITGPDVLGERKNDSVDDVTRVQIGGAIGQMGVLMASELAQANTFYVAGVRAWDMVTLIDNAEAVLSPTNQERLPKLAKNDIQEAGRCMAFNLPTAVGFHIFRAIETIVLLYYPIMGLAPPTKPAERNLGRYISDLAANGLDAKIEQMLNHLREHYRNPLMHPGMFLESDDAVDLFSFAQSAISRMLADQEEENSKRKPSP